MRKLYILLLLFIFLMKPAFAARPLLTDDSEPVANGKILIESGFIDQKNKELDYSSYLTTSIKYGISNSMDIGIDIPYLNLKKNDADPVAGFSDFVIKSKINILSPEDYFIGIALCLGTKLSNSSYEKGFGSGNADYFANIIFTKLFGDHKLHFNIGYTLVGDIPSQDFNNLVNYDLALEYKLIETIYLVGEITGSNHANRLIYSHPLLAILGANWKISPTFTLDIGYGFGLNDASLKNYSTMGVTIGI